MTLTFRTLVLAVMLFGLGSGVAFGAGVAYGRGDPKTVQIGLTQEQIQILFGRGGAAGGAGTTPGTGGLRGGPGDVGGDGH